MTLLAPSPEIAILLALAQDGGFGKEGRLPWHLSADLQRFRQLTLGYTILMGRKTWDSLPRKPLPERVNMVLSRDKNFCPSQAHVFPTVEQAIKNCTTHKLFIIGGAEVIRTTLPLAQKIYLTEIHATFPADVYLSFDKKEWREVLRTSHLDAQQKLHYDFVDFCAVGKDA